MRKPFVSLSKYLLPIALILPAVLFAESFKVTIDREAHIGSGNQTQSRRGNTGR